jgi:ribonuclease HI
VQCKVYAAIFYDQRCFGIGMCIRDKAEAMGLKEAIIWLGEIELSKVSIELDCKLVVDDIGDRSVNKSEFDNLLSIYRSLLNQCPNIKISFIRRQANYVSHCLARASQYNASHQIFELVPSCISHIVRNKMI